MKIHVKLFAILREKAGTSDLTVELSEPTTVTGLLEEIKGMYPMFLDDLSVIMVAVNTEYVQRSYLLRPGDDVALIPPVSGGTLGLLIDRPFHEGCGIALGCWESNNVSWTLSEFLK